MPFFAAPYNPRAGLYTGTSITAGNVTVGLEYVSKTNAYLRITKPLYAFTTLTNAGIGGSTSWYALARVASEFVGQDPDVLSLEYGVNDAFTDFYASSAEALIRRVRALLPDTRLVFIAFPKVADPLVDDATNTNQDLHTRWAALCAAYGIPFVDYAGLLKALVDGGATLADYMADTVHPTTTGHALAAGLIGPALLAAYGAGAMPAMPARIYDCADFEAVPVWRLGTDNDGETGTWSTSGEARTSSTAGSTITWTFTGVSFGYRKLVTSTGTVAISVDGGADIVHDLSIRGIASEVATILANAAHSVVFRVVSGTVALDRFVSI